MAPKRIHSECMTITLKDVPDDIHEDLRKRAENHGRSLNKEIAAILEAAVRPQKTNRKELMQRIEDRRARLGFAVDPDQLDAIIDKGRL